MKSKDRNPAEILARAMEAVRQDQMDSAEVKKAASRVWARLAQDPQLGQSPEPQAGVFEGVPADAIGRIGSCVDFQALIPSYLAGNLNPSRVLLLEDHTGECIPCRRALREARLQPAMPAKRGTASPQLPAANSQRNLLRWGIAAAIFLAIALTQLDRLQWLLPLPAETHAIAQRVDGTLFRVSPEGTQAMAAGGKIGQREEIRTAMNSGAVVRLADGSTIEMGERSQLSLEAARDGTTIRLGRGKVIVEAARQRSGHLYVATNDCLVSVTGTVFSVNKGAKGSRVSVIEGDVWVQQGKSKQVLHPGEQLATHSSLTAVAVEQEISWSRNVDAHIALLRELTKLRNELSGKLSGPSLRYDSRLLALVPEDTVLYAAFPNISETLGHAYDIFRRHVGEDPALSAWWDERARSAHGKPNLEEMIERMRRLGSFLGDEIVIAIPKHETRGYGEPLVMAEARNPSELAAALEDDALRLNSVSGNGALFRVVHNIGELSNRQTAAGRGQEAVGRKQEAAGRREEADGRKQEAGGRGLSQKRAEGGTSEFSIFLGNGLVAASASTEELRQLVEVQQGRAGNQFLGSKFHSRIGSAYSEGAGWLFAADMERILQDLREKEQHRSNPFGRYLGISDITQLVAEQKSVGGESENRVIVSFDKSRQGIAGWLAEPAPMGALDFVSPDALGVAAFAVRNPASLVDEIFSLIQKSDQKAWQQILDFQSQRGVNIRSDIAAPLGGEFLFALDGPVLPNPSWKIVAEVYDTARLQNTLKWAVEQYNQEASKDGKSGLMLTQESLGGKVFYRLVSQDTGYEADYVFHDGYLVMAPSRTLLLQTLQYRDTGYTLPNSPAFKALLPVDGRAHCSALIYHNILSTMGALAQHLPQADSKLSSEQFRSLQQIASQSPPALICIYAENDRIIAAAKGEVFDLGTLAGFGSLGDLLSLPAGAAKKAK
jgi:hypothetical protein